MNKHSHSILIFCLVIVTVLASGCGAVTAVPSPTGTPVPSLTPTYTLTKTPIGTQANTPIPEFGWSVLFKHEFEENYWTVGKHSYRIIASCPDTEYFGDIDDNKTFIVDANAFLWPADAVIELAYNNIGVRWDGYSMYTGSFQPQQKSRILFGYDKLSLEQAKQAINECQIYSIIYEEIKIELFPEDPIPWPYQFGSYSPK